MNRIITTLAVIFVSSLIACAHPANPAPSDPSSAPAKKVSCGCEHCKEAHAASDQRKGCGCHHKDGMKCGEHDSSCGCGLGKCGK